MKRVTIGFVTISFCLIIVGTLFAVVSPPSVSAQPSSRWMQYGILPVVNYYNLDRNITYNGFAQVMINLLGYQIDEKYLFNSGLMYIRHHEAANILTSALGKNVPPYPAGRDFLSFRSIMYLLDYHIQFFIREDFVINLADEFLEDAIVIHHAAAGVDAIVANVSGTGDIVIVPRHGQHALLENINTTGNIVIASGGTGIMNITMHNTRAAGLYVLGAANFILMGETEIGNIGLFAASSVNTEMLARGAMPPNVYIGMKDIALDGRFGEVTNGLGQMRSPVLIPVNGHITHLNSEAEIVLLGDVAVGSYGYQSPSIINSEGMYRRETLAESVEIATHAALADFLDAFMDFFEDVFTQDGASGANQTTRPPVQWQPTPPIITPPPPDPTPAPSP